LASGCELRDWYFKDSARPQNSSYGSVHRFNQGRHFRKHLKVVYSSYKIIFIQEHWLQPDECDKLNLVNSNFDTVCTSAMGKAVQSGIVKDRPFGGVGIMVHKQLANSIVQLVCIERLIIIRTCI